MPSLVWGLTEILDHFPVGGNLNADVHLTLNKNRFFFPALLAHIRQDGAPSRWTSSFQMLGQVGVSFSDHYMALTNLEICNLGGNLRQQCVTLCVVA